MRLSRLTRLFVNETGACAPADDAYQEWLTKIQFWGLTCNRAPRPVGIISARALTESGRAVGVSIDPYFSDPDDDRLTYAAASSQRGTVTTLVSGAVLWLVPGAVGTATVTVIARDQDGL